MKQIKFEDVTKSYNGKTGCMCGCQGNYSVASHYGIEAANKEIGYEGYDKCNDRSVRIAVNKINKAIAADVLPDGQELQYEPGEWYCLDTNERRTAVYLK